MAAKLSRLKTDQRAAADGVWAELAMGVKFLVAKEGNSAYRTKMAAAVRPYGESGPDQDVLNKLYREVAATTILVGWDGMLDEDGNEIPYSNEKALEILSDPDLDDVLVFVRSVSRTSERYRVKEKEDALKN